MFDRLDQIEARYEDLGRQLGDPSLLSDQKKFQTVAKQHRDLEPTVEAFRAYRKTAARRRGGQGDARASPTPT